MVFQTFCKKMAKKTIISNVLERFWAWKSLARFLEVSELGGGSEYGRNTKGIFEKFITSKT